MLKTSPEDSHGEIRLRHLPLSNVTVGPLVDLGPAGFQCQLLGTVGTTAVRLEVLLCRASSGSWYLAKPATPPCVWLGRVFAGNA